MKQKGVRLTRGSCEILELNFLDLIPEGTIVQMLSSEILIIGYLQNLSMRAASLGMENSGYTPDTFIWFQVAKHY